MRLRAHSDPIDASDTHEQARMARRSAKEELSYRALYSHALRLERERRMLEAATAAEARSCVTRTLCLSQALLRPFLEASHPTRPSSKPLHL